MNIKRIIFWAGFIIVLGLIVWGMAAALNRPVAAPSASEPAPVTVDDHVSGAADAPVTVIEYSDFQCPACAAYYPLIERLMAEASSSVRVVYRHFPLPQHRNAMLAAQASEAAAVQGAFWDMYELLFANQSAWESLSQGQAADTFKAYAVRLGLDAEKFAVDFVSDEVKAKVTADLREGQAIGIHATPTFFVNGRAIVNPSSYEEFKGHIDEATAPAAR